MLNLRTVGLSAACCVLLTASTVSAQQSPAPDFIPDYIVDGSQLANWQSVGGADWQATNGVITGNASSGSGLLLFDQSYENVAVYARFRCSSACDAGILLRAEETNGGIEGVLVAFEDEAVAPYRVRLNDNGAIVSKESARSGGGFGGGSDDEGPVSDILARARDSLSAPVRIVPGEWNEIEVFLDGNSIRNHLNNVRNAISGGQARGEEAEQQPRGLGGAIVSTPISDNAYGPIALYVGSARVEFDDVSVKNLLKQRVEPEITSSRFRVQRLNPFYYAWGADAADVNGDGVNDLVSGPFYYLGPDYQTRYEFYPARVFNPGEEYINDMITFAYDWTGDGWPDVLRTERRPIVMHVNPKGENRLWDQVDVLPDVCSEAAVSADVDGDGEPEVVYVAQDGRVTYGEPDPDNPMGPFLTHAISQVVVEGCNTHGIGTGDVNGDGLTDILYARGWWEQPASGADAGMWIHHDDWFGRMTRPPQHPGGAEISVYDFNGDGLNDVVTSLSAHGWGLAWYEQQRDGSGNMSFEEHLIMGDFSTKNAGDVTFSQLHSGATLADVDNDGVMDFVTGKRHWSHLDSYSDPDPYGEAVLYWYETVRNPDAPGGAAFVPHLIHNKSGVGSEIKVLDVNNDGAEDILTSGTHGTFIFWGK